MSLKSEREKAADELIGLASKPSTKQLIELQRAAEMRSMERVLEHEGYDLAGMDRTINQLLDEENDA